MTIEAPLTKPPETPKKEPSSTEDFHRYSWLHRMMERRGAKIGTGITLVGATALGLWIGLSNSQDHGPAPAPPVAAAPENPGEQPPENTAETLPTVESLEIDASLISNPESLAKTFFEERIGSWFNAGATPENYKILTDKMLNVDDFATDIAKANRAIYANALFESGWENDPNIDEYVDHLETINKDTLVLYFATYDFDPEPYARHSHVDTVEAISAPAVDTTTLQVVIHDTDISGPGKNRVGAGGLAPAVNPDDKPASRITWVNDGGKSKISSISPLA